MPKSITVKLTDEQWIEVYYALENKITMLKRREIRGPRGGLDRKWIRDMKKIVEDLTDQLADQGLTRY